MNIQISVIIWTVICFALLFIVLSKLLFKPVLKVMDDRNKKIESAKKRKADAVIIAEKQAALDKERLENEARQTALKEKEQAEKVRLEGKKSLDEARKERIITVEEYRKKTDAEFETDMEKARADLDNLSVSFLDKLFAS